jgi:transposase
VLVIIFNTCLSKPLDCPKCASQHYVKDGIVSKKQRYRCKNCNYRYTVQKRKPRIKEEVKRFAIELYLEGLGLRAIGRLLKVSQVSVMNWVFNYAEKLDTIKAPEGNAV